MHRHDGMSRNGIMQGGQVLDDLVAISYINTPRQVLNVLNELRKMGVQGKIDLCVEYVEGYLVHIKSF